MKKFYIFILSALLLASGLAPLSVVSAEETNLIPNPSVETAANVTTPQSWTSNTWGTNTASFEYLNEGHTGSRSVKTEITSYTDGDAKWFFDRANVEPNDNYEYSDYYKSNVETNVFAWFTHTDGSSSYEWLGSVPASPLAWQQTTMSFNTPGSATQVSIFHVVSSVGWLSIDDAELVKVEEPDPDPEPGENLIPNPSVETAANVTTPQSWTSNTWGTNTASFEYLNEGHTGSRSVKTEITSYTDGDAKWFFDSANVTPNTQYQFSDYYKANVSTEVIIRVTHNDSTYSYQFLGTASPSETEWAQATYTFTTPATAQQVSVFHIVPSVGWLIMDDAVLGEVDEEPSGNPVPNPSVETVSTQNPTLPDKWHTDSWGNNTATHEYLNEGHTGDRSVKVSLSNYVDGDAKWYFDPITEPESGKSYSFSAWFKTNTTPHVALAYTMNDGSIQYKEVRDPFPTVNETEWQSYSGSFTVPTSAQSLKVYFFINANGWLQVDDYSIEPYEPIGFNRPLVSLTFDDSFIDNVDTALPVMESYGFKSTQCYGSAFVEAVPEGEPAVNTFYDAGHEICSHTVTHPFLTQLSPEDVDYELSHSQDVLESIIGEPVTSFASPFGDYNFPVNEAIKQYYSSHRTVDEGYNSKDNLQIDRVLVQNLLVGTTIEEFQSWVDYAAATNTWLVLVYHRVTSAADIEPFDTYEADFQAQMAALDASGITVKTYEDALDELVPQL